jgi:hypothetical protein
MLTYAIGVSSDYEAALNLVDIVDAYDGRHGIILANVARRDGSIRQHTPANTSFTRAAYVSIRQHTSATLARIKGLLRLYSGCRGVWQRRQRREGSV